MRRRPPLWSRNFALVCASTLFFYSSFMMQIPVFPDFLRRRAGASDAVVGLFIGLASVLAVLARPLVGRELERRARSTFMTAGGLITASATVVYLTTGSLAILIPIRLYHGLAAAFFYTAASTAVADLAPEERRGEGLSYFSMFLYLGLAGGPAVGLALEQAVGFRATFAVSAGLGLACAAVARGVGEARVHVPETLDMERRPLLNRAALFPAGVLVLAAVGYAAGINFTADFAAQEGIGGRTAYFPVLAGTVILTRFFAGRASDRFGRLVVAAPGLALFVGAMALEAAARSTAMLLGSGVLFGVGFGMFFPSMMAFTVDRVPPAERGSAMATFTTAFDVGFGAGSPILGSVKGAAGYPAMYLVASGCAAASLVLLVAGRRRPAALPAEAPL